MGGLLERRCWRWPPSPHANVRIVREMLPTGADLGRCRGTAHYHTGLKRRPIHIVNT
jgi:hypothetical protein